MATFGELQKKLNEKKEKQALLSYVIDGLEENLVRGKMVLVTDEKSAVSAEAIDAFIEAMNGALKTVTQEINEVLNTKVGE